MAIQTKIDFQVMSRRTDPHTSHEAAERVTSSGAASAQREACLRAVVEHPGLTAAEIAEVIGVDRHAPGRRLPELRQAGLIRNGEARACRVKGTNCLSWWPVYQEVS